MSTLKVAPSASAPFIEQQGVRLAQTIQVGPCIPVGILLQKAEAGPTSGPTRRLSHLWERLDAREAEAAEAHLREGRAHISLVSVEFSME
jgi:hypothetical protein